MKLRLATSLVAATLLVTAPLGARAQDAPANPMQYRMLALDEAATLPRNHGALGMDVDNAQRITDAGLNFELIRITNVKRGSAGAKAGFKRGDSIIAIDGRVFPTLNAFAAYVGSHQPGSQMQVDYIPAGGGPQQAQRIVVTVGPLDQAATASGQPAQGGMSTGTKLAIGAAAAALLCYKFGCFKHSTPGAAPVQ